jgi:hypothetical protein
MLSRTIHSKASVRTHSGLLVGVDACSVSDSTSSLTTNPPNRFGPPIGGGAQLLLSRPQCPGFLAADGTAVLDRPAVPTVGGRPLAVRAVTAD